MRQKKEQRWNPATATPTNSAALVCSPPRLELRAQGLPVHFKTSRSDEAERKRERDMVLLPSLRPVVEAIESVWALRPGEGGLAGSRAPAGWPLHRLPVAARRLAGHAPEGRSTGRTRTATCRRLVSRLTLDTPMPSSPHVSSPTESRASQPLQFNGPRPHSQHPPTPILTVCPSVCLSVCPSVSSVSASPLPDETRYSFRHSLRNPSALGSANRSPRLMITVTYRAVPIPPFHTQNRSPNPRPFIPDHPIPHSSYPT